MEWDNFLAPIHYVDLPVLTKNNVELAVLREDLVNPLISGNKYRKLKYNLLDAKKSGYKKIVTFGGAYSNHIAATAAAAKKYNFKAIGIIRGEEIIDKIEENPTLSFAKQMGMKFDFISRESYREKTSDYFLNKIREDYPDYYIIPEGGTNDLAIKGCEEILYSDCFNFNYLASAIGTAGTITGLINSKKEEQEVLGFPALKGNFFEKEINSLTDKKGFTIFKDYNFGGYAKVNDELIDFINWFKKETNIPLDPIYTGKMMFGLLDLVDKKYFDTSVKILAVHTGGLQGVLGINKRLQNKNKTIIL